MEFRLVIPAEAAWDGPTERIFGKNWRVSEPIAIENSASFPGYHVVSYSWGKAKSPNLFSLPGEISARTRGALEAAIRSNARSETQAYWIDAVCVPRVNPQRLRTLESMGFVYAGAQSCIVLLEKKTWNVLHHDAKSMVPLAHEDMQSLNEEPWLSSVWTYQELMNPITLTFTTYDMQFPIQMAGDDFLNTAGFSLHCWKRDNAKSELDSILTYPGLNALQDALADSYQNCDYLEVPAMSCLTGIAGRLCDPARPTNRLYALFGLLSQAPSWGVPEEESVVALSEKAMALCEAKEDFSFIFTSNPRCNDQGRLWRPQPDPELGLVPLLRWHSYGKKQAGALRPGGLELHEMVQLKLTQGLTVETIKKLSDSIHGLSDAVIEIEEDILIELRSALEKLGLKSDAHCLPCDRGLILCNTDISATETFEPYASVEIAWAFGHPGIAKVFERGVLKKCVPFVYTGLRLSQADPKVRVELF